LARLHDALEVLPRPEVEVGQANVVTFALQDGAEDADAEGREEPAVHAGHLAVSRDQGGHEEEDFHVKAL